VGERRSVPEARIRSADGLGNVRVSSREVRTNLRVARKELEQEAPDGVAADPYLATRNGHNAKKGKKARL